MRRDAGPSLNIRDMIGLFDTNSLIKSIVLNLMLLQDAHIDSSLSIVTSWQTGALSSQHRNASHRGESSLCRKHAL
jgi:hypothetical protein